MKYLLVTDIPAPWREKVFENVYKRIGDEFHVIYCKHNEKRRLWKFPLGKHPKTFLSGITISTKRTKENYFNLGIIPFLLKSRPRVVVCFSLNPTIFITLIISKLMNTNIAVFADTWIGRDKELSWFQKIGRKLYTNFFPDAFIGASRKTLAWYRYYNNNIPDESLFVSSLCADNEYFERYNKNKGTEKKYDIMFAGRIVDRKNPLFFADVAKKIKEKSGKCKALIMGDGDHELKAAMFNILKENSVDYHFAGFVEHNELPKYYPQAKLLLFPTSGDCWGVVINEAFVSGVPVITTDMTAAAGELVLDGKNGYVLPMDSDLWVEKIRTLLESPEKLHAFSKCARETVRKFNFANAAEGIIACIDYLKANSEKRE